MGDLRNLSTGLQKRIGDGTNTRFWVDRWLDKPLLDYENVSASVVDLNARVSDYILEAGSWNSESIFAQVPLEAANKILGYPLPKWKDMADSYVWSLTSKGNVLFSICLCKGGNLWRKCSIRMALEVADPGPLVHFSVASMAR